MKHFLKITISLMIISLIIVFAVNWGHKYFNELSNNDLYWLMPLIVFLCCAIAYGCVLLIEKFEK